MKTFWITLATLFLAELGDKTQLSVITLTAKTKQPWLVFFGASLALVVVTLLGVLVGEALVKVIPIPVIKKISAAAFILIGILIFLDKI